MTHAAGIEVATLRADFPILNREGGRRLVYLDSAATSQKPWPVLGAMENYYRETNANVHRGVYELAAEATERFEAARDRVAAFVGTRREGLVFTKNATEALNLIAWAWGMRNLAPGDVVVTTEMEHHSNIVPWQIVAEMTGARVLFIPVDGDGQLDLQWLSVTLRTEPVRVVSVTHVSNVLGTINPVAEIARSAHSYGALVVVDGAQSVPHMPVSLASMISKYSRELMMARFQSWFTRHAPHIKPTAGYASDAKRFWQEIQPMLEQLGIHPEQLRRQA